MAKCKECQGKKYRLSTRDDGYIAVERCDECSWYGDNDKRTISDEAAAKLAAMDGIICSTTYPCYVFDAYGRLINANA